MYEKEMEIKIEENKSENLDENNNIPFVNLDNIDKVQKNQNNELILENNINGTQKTVTEEENLSESSNTITSSQKEDLNSRALYEESKKSLEPYQNKMIYTIKNIEQIVKTGERQRNYKMKSEFEREKEYKLEEQDEIKNKIIELSKNNINEKLISHFNIRINQ